MIIIFTKYFGSDPMAYFQKKWSLVHGLSDVAVYELSLAALDTSNPSAAPVPLLGDEALPEHEESHRNVAIEIADRAMSLLEDEKLVEPESLHVLAGEAVGVPKGSLALRRVTNHSEALYFYPCTNVVDGILYRQEAHRKSHETRLATMRGSRLSAAPSGEEPAVATAAAEPITTTVIALYILNNIVSGALSQVGSMAVDYAFKLLGIADALGIADDTYEQTVKALRLQSRADFRRQIQIKLAAFDRLRKDYHAGARTEEQLNTMYNEIRHITSWLEADERSPDRVQLLAMTQAMYLAVMQERAEWYRTKDPAKLKSFYQALVAAAGREATLLKQVRQEAFDQRLAKITGVHNRPQFPVDDRIVYFDDAVWRESGEDRPIARDWEWAQVECLERNINNGICERWKFTVKGEKAVGEIRQNMEQHRKRIADAVYRVLGKTHDSILKFEEISRTQVPPPPPK